MVPVPRITKVCLVCKKKFLKRRAEIVRGKGKYCSYQCRGKALGDWRGKNQAGPKNPNWKGAKWRINREKKYMVNFPEAYATHRIVQEAYRKGTLKRGTCEVCSKPKAVAHHDDYSKPFQIRWLCRRHHAQWHATNGKQKPPNKRVTDRLLARHIK